jgi:hypothetical protein
MSLIKCPKCQSELSDTDIFCSQCGYSLKNDTKKDYSEKKINNPPPKKGNGCGVALVIGIALLFIIFLIKTCSKTEDTSTSNTTEPLHVSKEDSIRNKIRIDSIDKQQKIEEEKFLKTKAGKIYKKHPEWSKEDCIKIADHQIWIGMHYNMLVYMRGKPNSVNTSNYGDGPHYQACWHDYDPSCFYFDESQIITSYN